jgi:hypothetical protein
MINDLANRALTAVMRVMGEPITYSRGNASYEARGVFQASHVGLDPDTGMQVNSTQPIVLVDEWDIPIKPKAGDEVEVRSTTYKVRDAQPDGHTGFTLMLHRTVQTIET